MPGTRRDGQRDHETTSPLKTQSHWRPPCRPQGAPCRCRGDKNYSRSLRHAKLGETRSRRRTEERSPPAQAGYFRVSHQTFRFGFLSSTADPRSLATGTQQRTKPKYSISAQECVRWFTHALRREHAARASFSDPHPQSGRGHRKRLVNRIEASRRFSTPSPSCRSNSFVAAFRTAAAPS